MDVLYVKDIPQEYHFAEFNTYYIDLYNTQNLLPGRTYNFYRVYMYDNYFAYDQRTRTISQYSSGELAFEISVSDKVFYRRDFPSIFGCYFGFLIVILFVINLMTSLVRKGGVLGGLF